MVEPGGEPRADSAPARFVIQLHDATRLHYDLRIQRGGVMRSWAVPKGPSLDPADRVALIDWDEAHVDVPLLDLVLPHNAAALDDAVLDVAAQASAAWEAAVCWDSEYAVKRLAEVRAP